MVQLTNTPEKATHELNIAYQALFNVYMYLIQRYIFIYIPYLNIGTGEPWAAHVNATELCDFLIILDPSFSPENFGIEPPIGSKIKTAANHLNDGVGEP